MCCIGCSLYAVLHWLFVVSGSLPVSCKRRLSDAHEWLQDLELQPRSTSIPLSISKRNGKKQATTTNTSIPLSISKRNGKKQAQESRKSRRPSSFSLPKKLEAAFNCLHDQNKASLLHCRLQREWMKVNWPDCEKQSSRSGSFFT